MVDGLDECDKGERKAILSVLSSIIIAADSENPGMIRGLFISQDERDIRKLLCDASVIRFGAKDNQKDIESYAAHRSVKIQQKFDLPTAMSLASIVSTRAEGNCCPLAYQLRLRVEHSSDVFICEAGPGESFLPTDQGPASC